MGENLKNIRREMGLRQHEIVGNEVTRNLISMIENNKSPLYYRIAKLISQNINKISYERGMEIFISPEDIMDPNRMEAKRKADNYIKDLKKRINSENYNISEEYIYEIEEFLKEWNISDKKVVIYELLGDIAHYNNSQYEYLYLTRALENYFINPVKNDIAGLVIKLMTNCIKSGKYKETIRLSSLDFIEKENISKEHNISIEYKKALAYKEIGNYDEALEVLNEVYKRFGEDFKEYSKSLILKGICYNKKNQKEKAIIIFKQIVGNFQSKYEEKAIVYFSIIEIYKSMEDNSKVIKFRDELLDILPNFKLYDKQLIDIYFNLAETNEYLKDYETAEYYYVKAFVKSIDIKVTSKLSKIVLSLLKLYNKTAKNNRILSNNFILKEYFNTTELTDDMKLAFKLILTYLEAGKSNNVKNLINKFLEDNSKY